MSFDPGLDALCRAKRAELPDPLVVPVAQLDRIAEAMEATAALGRQLVSTLKALQVELAAQRAQREAEYARRQRPQRPFNPPPARVPR